MSAQSPASDLWLLPSGKMLCLDDIACVEDYTEPLDGGKERIYMHIGYKCGGVAYVYADDVPYVYGLLRKGAHDVEVA